MLVQIDPKKCLYPFSVGEGCLFKVGVSFDLEIRTAGNWIIAEA